jgi:hypothetical protein
VKNFSEFSKINENVATMVFKPTSSFEDRLIMNRTVLLFDMTEEIELSSPPPNDSDTTRAELSELADHMECVTESTSFVMPSVADSFFQFCSSMGLNVDGAKLSTMIHEVRSIVRELQYRFNRPRPNQIARSLGVGFPSHLVEIANTPSYPAERSVQSYTISSYLTHRFPTHEQDFLNMAEEMGMSHVLCGLHFPSDHESGRQIGRQLFNRLVDKT